MSAAQEQRRVTELGDPLAVGRDQHRTAVLAYQPVEQGEHGLGGVVVEVAGRFVGKDDGGPMRERPRDRDTLLLAAGQHVRQ